MSDVLTECPNCKATLVDGKCPECGFKSSVVLHKVQVDKDEIAKQVREQIERESKIDKTMQQFQTLKTMAKEQHSEGADQIDSCQSPAEIMEIVEQARSEKLAI
jgi:uncharacterized Zn finger protein (UPF0148 family)